MLIIIKPGHGVEINKYYLNKFKLGGAIKLILPPNINVSVISYYETYKFREETNWTYMTISKIFQTNTKQIQLLSKQKL